MSLKNLTLLTRSNWFVDQSSEMLQLNVKIDGNETLAATSVGKCFANAQLKWW